ncbi:hypothetical protein NECAME_11268, partial [Necator americanus]
MLFLIALAQVLVKITETQLAGSLGQRMSATPPQSIEPLSNSQLIFLNTVTNVQQPGIAASPDLVIGPNQSPRITHQNLRELDWTRIDRRSEEGWWHLYPFGERYFDDELSHRPWMDKQIDLDFFLPYYGFRFNYTFIFQEGFIAFSHPWYVQPPYSFPNPHWPSKPDPSLIAVGFNGGNGTGFYQLPFSSEGNSYKLVQYGSTQVAGRWMARIDEQIQYGGCTNDSRGSIELSQQYGNMLGGFALNVTGPCLRPSDVIKMQFDEITLDCERMDMVMARCVIPTNSVFKIGLVDVKLSNLTLSWEWENITANTNTAVDIALWGYWEDTEGHSFKQIGYIAKRHPNNGILSFSPRNLEVDLEGDVDAWRFYHGGVIQVRATDTWLEDRGDRMHWSMPIPFGWFFYKKWEYEYGRDWALQICQHWFDYDGRRENFVMELEPK